MRQTLVVLHLWAQSLEEGDEHPYAVLWSMVDFTFTLTVKKQLQQYYNVIGYDGSITFARHCDQG